MSTAQIRAQAAGLLADLWHNKAPFRGPTDPRLHTLPESSRGEAAALIWGVCRFYPRLITIAQACLKKPLRAKDQDILALILLGAYQLEAHSLPDHAAVHETVEAAKQRHKPWACGLLNALLRQWPEQAEGLQKNHLVQTAHPTWLLDYFQQDWPTEQAALIQANNQQAPLTLRVNAQHFSHPESYLTLLEQAGIAAHRHPELPWALTLQTPRAVDQLPGFETGQVSVQDSSAQWLSTLIPVDPPLRILDACAAPGGKMASILETQPKHTLVALESNPQRFERLKTTAQRCGLSARLICADATQPDTWWDGTCFDWLILDVPCSGTGVIRRHPDLKYLRTPEEIQALILQQRALLQALWPCLKPGGTLLYATCSILACENEAQMAWFCSQHADARPKPCVLPWRRLLYGAQHLPCDSIGDGFYIASLIKKGAL